MSGRKRFKRYNEDSIDSAIELVHNGLSVRKAASNWDIPYETLRRKLKIRNNKKTGSKPHLQEEDETVLSNYAQFAARTGVPETSKCIQETAGRIADKRYDFDQFLFNPQIRLTQMSNAGH